jgi:hypothetical protein
MTGQSCAMIRSLHAPDFKGWTLEEAVRRVGDPFRWAVEQRLIVLGRNGSPHADFSYFPLADLLDEFRFNPVAVKGEAEANCAGTSVFDIRVYPVLKAPNLERVLHDIPLKTAFELYIIGDPEVERLGANAVFEYKKLASVYFAGDDQLRFWPLDSGRLLEVGELDDHSKFFHYHPTPGTHAASLALRDRLDALLGLLRHNVYRVEGEPFREAEPRIIPTSHWLCPALWLDLQTGDVVSEREWAENEVDCYRFDDGRENYTVRWRATMLVRTGLNSQNALPVHTVTRADRNTPKRIETKASSERAAEAWLKAQVLASPEPTQTKAHWSEEIKKRWPDVVGRAFDRVWGNSIRGSRWSAPGPRTS